MGKNQLHLFHLLAGRIAHTGRGSLGIIGEALRELPAGNEADAEFRADAQHCCTALEDLFNALSFSSLDFEAGEEEHSLGTLLSEHQGELQKLGISLTLPASAATRARKLSPRGLHHAIKGWHRYASLYVNQTPITGTLSISLNAGQTEHLELSVGPLNERSQARFQDAQTITDLFERDHRWETLYLLPLVSVAEAQDTRLTLACRDRQLRFLLDFPE